MTEHPVDYETSRSVSDRRLSIQRASDQQRLADQRASMEISDSADRVAPLFYVVMGVAAIAIGMILTHRHMVEQYAGSVKNEALFIKCVNEQINIVWDTVSVRCVTRLLEK